MIDGKIRKVSRPLRQIALWLLVGALCATLLPIPLGPLSPAAGRVLAQQAAGLDENNVQRATVSIAQITRAPGGQPVISCYGSGTLVTADGLILTNAHIARGTARCRTDDLVISITSRPGQPPIPTYYADVVQFDSGVDLAVIRIARALDGRAIDRATLSLPFVTLGDSETLALDDTITVIGYPSVTDKSNGAVTSIKGTVTNFLDEARIGTRAWIKTNAPIPARMSGGGAYDKGGSLIAVPTVERQADQSSGSCRFVQDTNGDGRIDNNDVCIPTGGFVDVMRPIRLARGLIRAAQLGVRIAGTSPTQPLPVSSGAPTLDRLLISTTVSSSGMPSSVVRSAPAGTKSLYLFFDYRNMTPDLTTEMRVTIDGVPNALFSLSPTIWSGGTSGMWYIGASQQVWPNGQYVFTLLVNGVRAASLDFSVGGQAQNAASFSDILFGITGLDRSVVPTGTVLPVNSTINAEFVYNNVQPGTRWRQQWYYDGTPISATSEPIDWKEKGTDGKKVVSIGTTGDNALIPGRYRLELYLTDPPGGGGTVGERLAATSDFTMAGVRNGDQVRLFDKPAFSSEPPVIGKAQDKDPAGKTISVDQVVNANTSFPNTIKGLYMTVGWYNIAPGTSWTWRLTVDGNPLFESTQPWQASSDSRFFWLRMDAPNRLTDGTYTLQIFIEGLEMTSAAVKVGIGQLPIETFLQATGVQLQGRIIDAETRKGIAGVMFIVIKGAVITREFSWDSSEIVETSITDSEGQFQLNRLLPRNNTYNVLIVARGYLPVSTDGITIDSATRNPFILNIELNKD